MRRLWGVRTNLSLFRRILSFRGLFKLDKFLNRLGKAGISIVDPCRGPLLLSEFWYKILGVIPEPGTAWLSLVHPDDLQRVLEQWNRADRENVDYVQSEFRFRKPDGNYEWISARYWVLKRSRRGRIRLFLGLDLPLRSVKSMQEDFQEAARTASLALEDGELARGLGLGLVASGSLEEFWRRVLESLPRLFTWHSGRVIWQDGEKCLLFDPGVPGCNAANIDSSLWAEISRNFRKSMAPRIEYLDQASGWLGSLPPALGLRPENCDSRIIAPFRLGGRMAGLMIFGRRGSTHVSGSEVRRLSIFLDFLEPAYRGISGDSMSSSRGGLEKEDFQRWLERAYRQGSGKGYHVLSLRMDQPVVFQDEAAYQDLGLETFSGQIEHARDAAWRAVHDWGRSLAWVEQRWDSDTLIAVLEGGKDLEAELLELRRRVLDASRAGGFVMTIHGGLASSRMDGSEARLLVGLSQGRMEQAKRLGGNRILQGDS